MRVLKTYVTLRTFIFFDFLERYMVLPSTITPKADNVFSFINARAPFEAVYTAIAGMQFSVPQMSPEKLQATIRALAQVLDKRPHKKQRQS